MTPKYSTTSNCYVAKMDIKAIQDVLNKYKSPIIQYYMTSEEAEREEMKDETHDVEDIEQDELDKEDSEDE